MTDAGLAKEADMYFMGVVERGTGRYLNWYKNWLILVIVISSYCPTLLIFFSFFPSARLQAAVVMNPRYPEVSPLFSLSLSWKGERSGRTDDNLRV